ncbi:MAG TPA: hypothetical protein VKE27_08075 [Candidatus Dormibacteraeota bacterium]|nr:hypothetical protein [Candidatus Dormibacteraeota bacterium]
MLVVLLFLIGITVLRVRALLPQHLFLGLALIPPVGLKLFSTGYRFVRYYTGDTAFRLAGTPELLPRLIAPMLVLTTVAVFATGLELWIFGLRFGAIWVGAHKISFLVWLPFALIHVFNHLNKSGQAVVDELSSRRSHEAAFTRRSLVVGSLVAGIVLAIASVLYASPFVFFGEG